MLFWIITLSLFVIGVVLLLNAEPSKSNEKLELWMNPGTGNLYILHTEERVLENQEGVCIKVYDTNKQNWVLEKIGDL